MKSKTLIEYTLKEAIKHWIIDHWLLIIAENALSIVFLLIFCSIKTLKYWILKYYEKQVSTWKTAFPANRIDLLLLSIDTSQWVSIKRIEYQILKNCKKKSLIKQWYQSRMQERAYSITNYKLRITKSGSII